MKQNRRTRYRFPRGEGGISLLETILALALLGIISVAFLGALATSSKSRLIADEQVTARTLAESQFEDIKRQEYAASYNATDSLLDQFPGYTISTDVSSLGTGIQKVVITVSHASKDIHVLEGYKVDR